MKNKIWSIDKECSKETDQKFKEIKKMEKILYNYK